MTLLCSAGTPRCSSSRPPCLPGPRLCAFPPSALLVLCFLSFSFSFLWFSLVFSGFLWVSLVFCEFLLPSLDFWRASARFSDFLHFSWWFPPDFSLFPVCFITSSNPYRLFLFPCVNVWFGNGRAALDTSFLFLFLARRFSLMLCAVHVHSCRFVLFLFTLLNALLLRLSSLLVDHQMDICSPTPVDS